MGNVAVSGLKRTRRGRGRSVPEERVASMAVLAVADRSSSARRPIICQMAPAMLLR